MIGIFDSGVKTKFYRDIQTAKSISTQEAAISSGIVLRTLSVRIETNSIFFIGDTSRPLIASRMKTDIPDDVLYMELTASRISQFHTTWGCIMDGRPMVGMLTFNEPSQVIWNPKISIENYDPELNFIVIGVKTPRIAHSIGCVTVGMNICRGCGREIDAQRVRIIPDVQYCPECQTFLEERKST